jgi:hypothetical protein
VITALLVAGLMRTGGGAWCAQPASTPSASMTDVLFIPTKGAIAAPDQG